MRKIFVLICAALLCACSTSPEGTGAASAQQNPDAAFPPGTGTPPAGRRYAGDGGKGVSITIVAPEGKNLRREDSYLPSLVQNGVSGDFTAYSAMSVKDWASLSRVLAEIESVVYAEGGDFIEAGTIAQTQYILTGELTGTGAGFALNLVITDAATGDNKAAYTAAVSAADLVSLRAVRAASASLLSQMGVTLTDAGRAALLAPDAEQSVRAEAALARGTAAQRGGSLAEAMDYYAQAASEGSGLLDAAARLDALTRQIESGDIGAKVRTEIEQRGAWKKLLEDAVAYYSANPVFDIVYNAAMIQGGIDFKNNTAAVSFDAWLAPNPRFTAMMTIFNAYWKLRKEPAWNLRGIYAGFFINDDPSLRYQLADFDLLDAEGFRAASAQNIRMSYSWGDQKGQPVSGGGPETDNFAAFHAFRVTFSVSAEDVRPPMSLALAEARNITLIVSADRQRRYSAVSANARLFSTTLSMRDYFRRRRNLETFIEKSTLNNMGAAVFRFRKNDGTLLDITAQ